jgi:hypothetical protein
MSCKNECELLKISVVNDVCITNSLSKQCQKIQNAADDKQLAPGAQIMNGVELQFVHSPLLFMTSKNLLSQNKTD